MTRTAADIDCGQEAEMHPSQSIHPKECLMHKRGRRIRDRSLRVKGMSRRKKWGDRRRDRDLFNEAMIAAPETAAPLPTVEGNIYV